MKAFIVNGCDQKIVDFDPDKYTRTPQHAVSTVSDTTVTKLQFHTSTSSDYESDSWPRGPYTQQIQGILPSILTDDIILTHLQI